MKTKAATSIANYPALPVCRRIGRGIRRASLAKAGAAGCGAGVDGEPEPDGRAGERSGIAVGGRAPGEDPLGLIGAGGCECDLCGDQCPWKGEAAGITIEPQWGSLKRINEARPHAQVNEEQAKAIVAPLKSLHDRHGKMKGHTGGTDAKGIHEGLIAKDGDLKSHFRALADDCDRTIAGTALADAGVL